MAASAQDVQRMALAVLQSRLSGSQLVDEFRSVIGRDYHIRCSFTVAQAPANAPKNRYVNVLPYDHNRVLLKPCCDGPTDGGRLHTAAAANGHSSAAPSPCPSPGPDYINASHVEHADAQCGFTVRYIACQGPLLSTVADFWHMCWAEGVGAVVMLTNTVERGVTKCSPYYPAQPGARLAMGPPGAGAGGRAGAAQQPGTPAAAVVPASPLACVSEVVALESRALHGGHLTHTRLQLWPAAQAAADSPPPASPCREVCHLRYNAWPDHGTPADAAAIRTLCDLLAPVRQAGGAVVVHCSAGIGRTGTFCAIDILRRRLEALAARAEAAPGSVSQSAVAAALDLPELVHSLRRQRGGMVQTLEQYAFCYQAVAEELAAAVGEGAPAAGDGGRAGRR
ncbi:hypothetical protein GPECTOR_5g459 [Gonium pectorale]|uniref:Uncharacterized protein n=1 Tax=Gonium pectorale TaxID=33097 RepID=A0A150GYI7_GONPE|nr:hypothetical protein GPECTOR_5g459 [Gonium pectorale]|eukprot:KXZ54380.1 hypothetical protein GPECTOR_5g459 [Gonium pectorale]